MPLRRAYIDPTDHAFASGPVFLRPAGARQGFEWLRHPSNALRIRRVWAEFERQAEIGADVRLGRGARLINRAGSEAVRVGGETVIRGILRNEQGGSMAIGSRVYIGDGVILSAMAAVEIGDETLIAHGVQLFDNDTHPLDAGQRALDFRRKLGHKTTKPLTIARAPVRIGRGCWLGMNSLVMKGVVIGDGTVVAGGSVVTQDLPAGIVAGGNPARPLRTLEREAA